MRKEIQLSPRQEMQRVPYRINPRRNMSEHILIKITEIKHKKRILKTAREKQQVTYKGKPIPLTVDLSAETLQARREWQDTVCRILSRLFEEVYSIRKRSSISRYNTKSDGIDFP